MVTGLTDIINRKRRLYVHAAVRMCVGATTISLFKQPDVIQSSRFILHRFDDQGIGNFMEKTRLSRALSKCYLSKARTGE